MAQRIVAISDSLFVVREGSTKAIAFRCFRGCLFISISFIFLLSHPFVHLIPCRGPNGIFWEIKVAHLGIAGLVVGVYELFFWRRIYINLTFREMEFRYGLLVDLWGSSYRIADIDFIEVRFDWKRLRRGPYRVLIKPRLRRRPIELDAYYEAEPARELVAHLSHLTGLPIRDSA